MAAGLSNNGHQTAKSYFVTVAAKTVESDFLTAETGNRVRLSNSGHQAVESDVLPVATNRQQSHELVTVTVMHKGWTLKHWPPASKVRLTESGYRVRQ